MTDGQVYASAAAMGAVAGMRSMSAPAMLSHVARGGGLTIGESKLGFLSNSVAANTMTALAIGEAIADKLPFMPSRTKIPSLAARAIAGALSGAAIASSRRRRAAAGAILGAAAAIGAAYGAYHL